MNRKEFDLYTDYLIASQGATTATGLSSILEENLSHDKITRFLSEEEYNSKNLWLEVKKTVRMIEEEEACLIFDDTIQEKEWTDENELICWHFDHSKGRNIKGINLLNAIYYSKEISIPVAFELVKKPIQYCDLRSRQVKRSSEMTKNEQVREMIGNCLKNQLKFTYVLMDSWYSSKENMDFILKKKKHFVVALKSNRLFASSREDKKQGRFTRIDALALQDQQAVRGWLKDFDREVLLVCRIFTNKDGSTGVLYLACSNLTLNGEQASTIYKKRWKVEEFHKTLKSNASLAKSPTRTVRTQSNHVFMSICAVFKLECLKIKYHLNHFALRTKIFINATRRALEEIQKLRAA